jgi:hypothetical protein
MLKSTVAATAVLAIAGSSIVYAQQRSGEDAPRLEQHYQPSAGDLKAFADARIAALRAGLQLTPDQEKNWPPFEQALRDLVKLHQQRKQEREAGGEQPPPSNPFDRLQRRADALSKFGVGLKQLADAGTPLYQSLSDVQKHRFTFLAHILRPHWMGGGGMGEEHRGFRNGERDGPHGMMDWDGGRRGMMGPDSDEDSNNR